MSRSVATLMSVAVALVVASPAAGAAAPPSSLHAHATMVRPPAPPINDRGPAPARLRGDLPPRGVDTIPWWEGSFTTAGQTYPYAMVGTNPAAGPATTTVKVKIIPMRIVFRSDGQVLGDPGMTDDVLGSPVFTPVDLGLGPLQWTDLIQHISLAAPADWHLTLAPEVLPTQTLTVDANEGLTLFDDAAQRRLGIVDMAWAERKAKQLLAALRIKPGELAVFLTDNTIGSLTTAADCVSPQGCNAWAGWHWPIFTGGGHGQQPPTQVNTAIWAAWRDYGAALPAGLDFRSEPLSHEVAEWAADPFLSNVVPQWQGPFTGASHQCQDLLEVADPVEQLPLGVPLSGGRITAMTNAATLSWFARQSPSQAMFGLYDLTGLLTTPSTPCG